MPNSNRLNLIVGLFIIAGGVALAILALQVSGFSKYSARNAFNVQAIFDNIGDLKVRAPVTIAGVRIGEVSSIRVDNQTFHAIVGLRIDRQQDKLPADSSAKILTAGIIGANYIELIPGFSEQVLQEGAVIEDTQSAVVLENLIGQFMYSIVGNNNNEDKEQRNSEAEENKDNKNNKDNKSNKSNKDNKEMSEQKGQLAAKAAT